MSGLLSSAMPVLAFGGLLALAYGMLNEAPEGYKWKGPGASFMDPDAPKHYEYGKDQDDWTDEKWRQVFSDNLKKKDPTWGTEAAAE